MGSFILKPTALSKVLNYERFLVLLWHLVVTTALFGHFLSWPKLPNIFAYRILLLLFIIFFIPYARNKGFKLFEGVPQVIKYYWGGWLVWLSWSAISLLWAADKLIVMRHIYLIFSSFCLVLFTSLFLSSELRLKRLTLLVFFITLIFMAIGLWESLTGNHLWVSGVKAKVFTPTAVFHNPNDFAAFLALALPFMYGMMRSTRHTILKLAILALLLFGFHLLLRTGGRASILAVLLEMAVGVWLIAFGRWGRIVKRGVITLFLIALIANSWPGAGEYVSNIMLGQIANMTEQLNSVSLADPSVSNRLKLSLYALQVGSRYYWMGAGGGNAEYHLRQSASDTMGVSSVHNWWIELLVDYGAGIWILHVTGYVALTFMLYRVFRTSDSRILRIWAEVALLSLTGFSLAVLGPSGVIGLRYFWIIIGFALAVVTCHYTKGNTGSENL